jgi:hypothetical protein
MKLSTINLRSSPIMYSQENRLIPKQNDMSDESIGSDLKSFIMRMYAVM